MNLRAIDVFATSDGSVTREYYRSLEGYGPLGAIAVNLFRAQKCSTRAKKYRGGIRGVGSYRSLAYDRKGWSLQQLSEALVKHGDAFSVRWGWGIDQSATINPHVLYVELPQGQVSFHSPIRYEGPNYEGTWDGECKSQERILTFCDAVIHAIQIHNEVQTFAFQE